MEKEISAKKYKEHKLKMMKFLAFRNLLSIRLGCVMLLAITVCACKKEKTYRNLPLHGPQQEFYVLSDNTLIKYNAYDVKTKISSSAITGTSDKLLSIDFRPATGELYAVSNTNKIYIINVASGIARAVATTAFTPALEGTVVSMDFNPATDRIRIVSNTGQNLNLNPETGVVETADDLVNAGINGIAHTNSFAGTPTTTLFDIDPVAKKLYKQEPEADGTLIEVGSLTHDLGTNVSLDISPNNENALAISKYADTTRLYTIDLTSGKTELSGNFAKGINIQGIAIATAPVAYAVTFDPIDHSNSLLIFNPITANAEFNKPITGLQANETIVGMDMRPLNGQIYAFGSTGRLYTINVGTGTFTQVGTTLSPIPTGTSFGFDFNPSTDLIRIVSNTGENLSLNPKNGSVTAVDSPLNPDVPTISAAAYASNFANATTTSLYVIDHATDKLYSLVEKTGTLTSIGDLTIDVDGTNGFDIISSSTTGNTAYAILTADGKNSLYKINLATGAATTQQVEFTKTISAFTLGLRF